MVTLLAETRAGYSNLCRLSSIAFGIQEEEAKGKGIQGRSKMNKGELARALGRKPR